ncbi:MAG TPA: DUF2127 domain-containing protein [Candidatus Sulfotelmatobacter sp.]|jgi:uncharacterized membrane protein (DUF2068 family)|nr:DUF2127 domain-containing protein [Candidatus Sulfotelmatobacter sp.]
MLSPATKIDLHRAQKNLLRVVASFEFTKGIFVLLIGLSALLLVHKDVWVIAESLLALLRVNTDRRWAQDFLDFSDRLTDARLWMAAQFAFAYSVLRFAEAYGLWMQRTWAEWLAFVSGTLFLPLEIRGLMRGITVLRTTVFVANIGIVLYMLFLLLSERQRRRSRQSIAPQGLDQTGN